MSLLVVTSFEFLQFLKIVMWITIPLIIISMLMVTFWHYRRKKKEALVDDPAVRNRSPARDRLPRRPARSPRAVARVVRPRPAHTEGARDQDG